MRDVRTRIFSSIRRDGLSKTFVKGYRHCYRRYQVRRIDDAIQNGTAEQIFSRIYNNPWYWYGTESASGIGSSTEYTANLRRRLPLIFKEFSITSIYDAPCGDFNWMKLVMQQTDITYYGADIVPELIARLQRRFGAPRISFKIADITLDEFPKVDLWFCRDCLFHLSNREIVLALQNFLASGTPFVLATHHLNPTRFVNVDVRTGQFRRIDLFSAPYLFPQEVLARISEIEPWPPREMCLWTREQVARAIELMA